MKKILFILLPILLAMPQNRLCAQSSETDSVNVLQYDIHAQFDRPGQTHRFEGLCRITFVRTRPCDSVTFDLICDTVARLVLDAQPDFQGCRYSKEDARITVALPLFRDPDTHTLLVRYLTNGHLENYNWGGLHIGTNVCYNLGVAFEDHPHNYGRAWFPCRDNFYDKATYALTLTSPQRYRHLCGGTCQSDTVTDSLRTSVWHINHPTPTYLVSIAMAPFHIIQRQFQGHHGTYPALIGFTTQDSTRVQSSYDILDDVLPMYEQCFGPYRWDRIGYIATDKGSMEHVGNIALVDGCMGSLDNACQMVVCHELSHSWFGNLVTCASEGDMWINEGGATFCEEVATEAAFGREAATDYYQDMLSNVLRNAHIDDHGYRALSGMDPYYTYGTTSYKQGGTVWHALRGTLGDSLFYHSMRQLFDRCAFGNLDATGLRDSLSRYSGTDLQGFFDAHVFNPGFVDYYLETYGINGSQQHLTIRQLLRGTDRYARGCRVPVTFFNADRSQQQKVWFDINDSLFSTVIDLPFSAVIAIIDYDHDISDACTDDTDTLGHTGVINLPHAFCKVNVTIPHGWLHIGHHYAHPTGDTLAGISRLADRYWQVTGNFSGGNTVRFLYNMGSNGSSGAANIDLGFYDRRATLDSLCLLYRTDGTEPWQIISRQRTSSSNTSTGYFVAHLYKGEYTLGVADPALPLMSVATPAQQPVFNIFPNPAHHNFRIDMGGYDKKFNLSVFDSMGRNVMEMNNIHDGDTIRHHLPAGSYIVLIQNNFLSLQSQIIIQ